MVVVLVLYTAEVITGMQFDDSFKNSYTSLSELTLGLSNNDLNQLLWYK